MSDARPVHASNGPLRSVRFRSYGSPADVLLVEADVLPKIAPDEVLVRTLLVPIHRGDLLAISGSPAFGDAPPLPSEGAVPGLEGTGVIEDIGTSVDDFAIGQRVAYFPVVGTWRSHVAVKATALAAIPDEVPDRLAARLLIDVATASLIVRRTLAEQPEPGRVLQSGAGSAVGRIVSALLVEAGVEPVRLAYSATGASRAAELLPGSPVFATAVDGWRSQLDMLLREERPSVAIDGVGGDLLGDVAARIAEGGLIVQYGTLGGARADIRPIVPRRLRIEGLSVADWFKLPEDVRADDVETALRLARNQPALFGETAILDIEDVAAAVKAMDATSRQDAVLLSFEK